jgi:acetylornithine/N-succinyldiaminopimelate aminotransferase
MVQQGQSSLFPTYARFPITLVKGEGSRVWDNTGKEYIDLMSGIAVTNLGHAPEQVKEKLIEQLNTLWHASNLFHLPIQEQVAGLLTSHSCADAVFFCSTGAEANEAAIKLARRYASKVLGTERYEIITLKQSFHGRTLATLTATGQDKVKEGFYPLPEGFVYADLNNIASVKALINDKTCAIMLELIQGEGGVVLAEQSFVDEVAALCKEHGLLLIIDEIQTGMGRTGKLFAYEHYGIEPDIFTLAKGLGSGFPVGAMLGKKKLIEAFNAGSHGSTFGGTPIALSAVLATLETIFANKITERAAVLGSYALENLQAKLEGNPLVKEIRGKGLLFGIACTQPVAELISAIHARGVLVISAGPNVIRILPSLTISEEDLALGLETICEVFAEKAAIAATAG